MHLILQLVMETKPNTKPCSFCGEKIQAVAIKCRFCGEWLENPAKRVAEPAESVQPKGNDSGKGQGNIYESSPSYFAMIGPIMAALFLIILSTVIIFVKVQSQQENIQTAKLLIGLTILLFSLCWILTKMASLKATFYRLSSERLEYHHGLIMRKVDNIDLFRVVDYRMERSLLDQMFGTGTIRIFTSDKVNPELELYKIKNPQKAYDMLKKTTTAADSKGNVIHLE